MFQIRPPSFINFRFYKILRLRIPLDPPLNMRNTRFANVAHKITLQATNTSNDVLTFLENPYLIHTRRTPMAPNEHLFDVVSLIASKK